ncbi:unnamed protein product [Vitrella brassicaformis CCMP3155]|uniref:SUEL-type lectin domain-containing protein n=1 Tax=Vitrella brassicaformis (strain CCMP3155) TaxID=1169540 RepID=A0A0G4GSR6_VITBC|nr:unnamed protein product [Vitrella brassicaformis CCMP3155]|eukprot:CEM33739.1 unnamed protein product [Vitrella brassicaformis CCMP3155]
MKLRTEDPSQQFREAAMMRSWQRQTRLSSSFCSANWSAPVQFESEDHDTHTRRRRRRSSRSSFVFAAACISLSAVLTGVTRGRSSRVWECVGLQCRGRERKALKALQPSLNATSKTTNNSLQEALNRFDAHVSDWHGGRAANRDDVWGSFLILSVPPRGNNQTGRAAVGPASAFVDAFGGVSIGSSSSSSASTFPGCYDSVGLQFICDGERDFLFCPPNKGLYILFAVYGRTAGGELMCRPSPVTTDCSHDVTRLLQERCNGQRQCDVYVSDALAEESTCTGAYLRVWRLCHCGVADDIPLSKVGIAPPPDAPNPLPRCSDDYLLPSAVSWSIFCDEDSEAIISCEMGKVLMVRYVGYGRSPNLPYACRHVQMGESECSVVDHTDRISPYCDNRTQCDLKRISPTHPSMPPCEGKPKYMMVGYECGCPLLREIMPGILETLPQWLPDVPPRTPPEIKEIYDRLGVPVTTQPNATAIRNHSTAIKLPPPVPPEPPRQWYPGYKLHVPPNASSTWYPRFSLPSLMPLFASRTGTIMGPDFGKKFSGIGGFGPSGIGGFGPSGIGGFGPPGGPSIRERDRPAKIFGWRRFHPWLGGTPAEPEEEQGEKISVEAGNEPPSTDYARFNLAVNKPTEQSSTVSGHESKLAVDGDVDSNPLTAKCARTQGGQGWLPWWRVDLQEDKGPVFGVFL